MNQIIAKFSNYFSNKSDNFQTILSESDDKVLLKLQNNVFDILKCSNNELNPHNISKTLYAFKMLHKKYSKQERYDILCEIKNPNKMVMDELNMLRNLYGCK